MSETRYHYDKDGNFTGTSRSTPHYPDSHSDYSGDQYYRTGTVGRFLGGLLAMALTILIFWGILEGLTYLVDKGNRSRGWPTLEEYKGR